MKARRRSGLLVLLVCVLSAGGQLAGASSAAAATVEVEAVNFDFQPSTVAIQVGDSVRWVTSTCCHSVLADDGSFSSGAPGVNFPFTREFNTPGTFRYYCQPHGGPGGLGMSGTVVVSPVGEDQPGMLRFSSASYSAGEGAGSATITVQRVAGDDGAAAVQYATSNITAVAGSDYTARSGTLSWANNDDNPKTFTVPVLDDAADEPNETVQLSLSGATGALLGTPAGAVLTLLDNDTPGGGNPPAAPTGLMAHPHSTTEIMLGWSHPVDDETELRIERRTLSGTFQQVATAPAGATSAIVGGLDPATAYVFRVRAANAAGASAPSNEVEEATFGPPGPCVEGPATLCLNGGRFRVEVDWRTASATGVGSAVPVPSAPDSGLFYFFSSSNIELLVKVLNACAPPFDRYWVFYAATTNVEITLTVTDTTNQRTRVYFNPLNRAAPPEQDTDAFATCP